MSIETWLTFLAASAVLCFTPGPTVLLVVGQALTYGRTSIVPLAFGTLLGDVALMTLSVLGLGVLLSISAMLFALLKLTGAAYLIYLGVKSFTRKPLPKSAVQEVAVKGDSIAIFRDAMIVTTLNPKAILFFMAFFPLFMTPTAPILPQLCILSGSFLMMSMLSVSSYGLLSGQLREHMVKPRMLEGFNKVGGSLLVAAGVLTGGMQRS